MPAFSVVGVRPKVQLAASSLDSLESIAAGRESQMSHGSFRSPGLLEECSAVRRLGTQFDERLAARSASSRRVSFRCP